ncbi:UNVERIFIED_CONTAM: hypothetical protein RMT77_007068 [Armadillidium vulgare]|nr:Mitochondrial inner membrane protease subunit 1 [Armadillidium vulgare]
MFINKIKKSLGRILGITGYAIQYGCIAHCTFEFIGDFVVCQGPSMEPTIFSKDVIITEHVSPRMNLVNRGDIIVARSPSNPHQFICKRVTALSGDSVKTGLWSEVVPRGHVWLEGDNKHNSTDSRKFGAIPQGLIRGRVIFRIWPLSEFGFLKSSKELI